MNNRISKKFYETLIEKNPALIHFMGLCPALAVTNTVYNSLGMSLSTSVVLLSTSVIVSAIRPFIPPEVRIPAYIIVIASLVSAIDVLLKAYFPQLAKSLGAFVSLIVVNCLILGQVESFSSRNPPLASLRNAWQISLGFSFALLIIALCRELLGSGSITIASKSLWPEAITWTADFIGGRWQFQLHRGQILTPFSSALGGKALFILALPAGALFVAGYLGALFAWLKQRYIAKTPKEKNNI